MPDRGKNSTHFTLKEKVRITASLVFDTGWRIGSGKEGEASDLGVLLDPTTGTPILPGSSLKGKLRSTCETLAHALGLDACLLDHKASTVPCISDIQYYQNVHEGYQAIVKKQCLDKRLAWIDENTCDVCKLFGSPVQASRLRVSDGTLDLDSWAGMVQVRDGVVIDRDSQTAVDGLKFDYEVVPPDSQFTLCIDLENPSDADLALIGVALFEWHAGSSLGGFTSRGLGRFRLKDIKVCGVNLCDPKQRVAFLTSKDTQSRLCDWGEWEPFFTKYIKNVAFSEN